MSCVYKTGGKENPLLTEILFYVEDTRSELRAAFPIEDIMLKQNVVFKKDDVLYAVKEDGAIKDINNLNEAARDFFGVSGTLVSLKEEGNETVVEINENILERMYPTTKNLNISVSKTSGIERVGAFTSQDSPVRTLKDKVFVKKQQVDDVTEKLINNVRKQISNLERLQQTDPIKSRVRELNVLQSKLRKIKKGHEKIEDYFEYVDYVVKLSERAEAIFDTIEDEYAASYTNMKSEDRASILNNISQLKQTLDSFYNDDRSKSMITVLEGKLATMKPSLQEAQLKSEMLEDVVVATANLKRLNDRYLDIAIPIQVDELLELAPIEVNKEIDKSIRIIQQALADKNYNIPYKGLSKRDPRAQKIIQETGGLIGMVKGRKQNIQERRRRLLELNIKQLEEKKIGRESMIKELRETHKDASKMSLYADPLVYNDELSIQLFANAVKSSQFEAHQNTIDFKYNFEPDLKKFLKETNANTSLPEQAYKELFETVKVRTKGQDGKVKFIDVLSIVQPYDIDRYNKNKSNFYKEAKKKYDFPEDPSDLDDYFKSAKGREYNAAVAAWERENSEVSDEARKVVAEMKKMREQLRQERDQAYKEGNENKGKELSYQYHALDLEIRKVVRTGVQGEQIVGALVTPKKSLYTNPRYTNMSAAAKQFHSVYMDYYKAHQYKIGKGALPKNSWDTFSYVLPSVRISATESMLNTRGVVDSVKLSVSDTFTLQETDTEFGELIDVNGEPMKFVPRYFTNPVDHTKVSKDIVNSLVKFVDMANRYEAKGKLLGVVNVMQDAVASRDVKVMTATGNYLVDKTAASLGFQIDVTKKGKDSNTYKALESFIDNMIYGETIKKSDKDVLGNLVSTTKTISSLTALTALARLSFNTLQASNQLIIDSTMNASEGWANQFYSRKNLFDARWKVLSAISIESKLDPLAPGFTKRGKLQQLMEEFDALQEMGGAFATNTGNLAKRLSENPIGTTMVFQQGAEYTSTAEKLVALMLSMEGKLKDKNGNVIKNKDGKPAHLYELYTKDKNGRVQLDPRVANFGIKERAKFSAKLHGIIKRTNQLKGAADKTLIERQNSTRLFAIFRRFIPPAYRKRFGHSNGGYHVNTELGDITEGYYITATRSVWSALKEIRKFNVASAYKTVVGKGDYSNSVERQNMIRFWHEQIYIQGLFLVTAFLAGKLDDDDEEYDTWLTHFAIYQAYRLRTELAAFYDPQEAFRLAKNPTAASQVIDDTIDLIGASWDVIAYNTVGTHLGIVDEKDVFYQRRSGRYKRGDAKWFKEFYDVAPIVSGLIKSSDPEKASKYYMQLDK